MGRKKKNKQISAAFPPLSPSSGDEGAHLITAEAEQQSQGSVTSGVEAEAPADHRSAPEAAPDKVWKQIES